MAIWAIPPPSALTPDPIGLRQLSQSIGASKRYLERPFHPGLLINVCGNKVVTMRNLAIRLTGQYESEETL